MFTKKALELALKSNSKAIFMCNPKSKRLVLLCAALSILAIVTSARAHESYNHSAPESAPSEQEKNVLEEINAVYLKEVKPIFQKSCFDCHSSSTRYPWYSAIPGASQLIASDIRKAKEHLDLSADFPFRGHGSPKQDLEAILKVVEDGRMPPLRYRMLHSGARLSKEAVRSVKSWVETSMSILNSLPPR